MISQKNSWCILPLVMSIAGCKIQNPPATQDLEINQNATSQINISLLYTGMIATGTAIGVGSTFGILSLKKSDEVDEEIEKINKKNNPFICLPEWHDPNCQAAAEAYRDSVTFERISWIGFGAAGSIGAATLVYYLVNLPNPPPVEKNITVSFELMDDGGILNYNISF